MPECLKQTQIDHFEKEGYLVLERHLPKKVLEALVQELKALEHQAYGLTVSNDMLDLEASHTPTNPRVRRIKQPHCHSQILKGLLMPPPSNNKNSLILAPVRDLLGTAHIRLQDTKCNMKAANYGAAVEWHQDWAYYPYTNDDILTVGILLEDVTLENAPLLVVPRTHTGPIFNHHDPTHGFFVGAMELTASGLDIQQAVPLTGPAGTMTFHHVRLVHGSALNTSVKDRRMVFLELLSADAYPIAGSRGAFSTMTEFESRMLCGVSQQPRLVACPVRLPLPNPPPVVVGAGSSTLYDYQLQMEASRKSFGVYTNSSTVKE
jgi:ectoine hydroxylase